MAISEKHLDYIQSAIARMAGHSFQLKAWNVALASAAIGFAAAKESHSEMAALAVVPSLTFWALDAYYLALEQSFRDLYAEVLAGRATQYSMTPPALTAARYVSAFFRPSVVLIHAVLVAAIVSVAWLAG